MTRSKYLYKHHLIRKHFDTSTSFATVITVSKLFTLMVLRPTQPSIPPGEANEYQLVSLVILATKTSETLPENTVG